MTKHIVMFKLQGSDELRRETALRFKDALDALPDQIDVLESIEVAHNENPARTGKSSSPPLCLPWPTLRCMPSIRPMWLPLPSSRT